MTTLDVFNLSITIKKKKLLSGITLTAKTGDVTVILGPNGAGKTTLLKSIIGLQSISDVNEHEHKNVIALNKSCISKLSTDKRVELGLVYLPQHSALFQQMSVQDNLALIFAYHHYWKIKPASVFTQERDQWLLTTGLQNRLLQQAGTLSGGQKRKLEIVRAALMHPIMLLLDEPFAGVDPKSMYELKSIFSAMAQNGVGIIISDHHVDQLLSIATTVYVVMDGQVVISGSVATILANKATRDLYLGNQFYTELTNRYLD